MDRFKKENEKEKERDQNATVSSSSSSMQILREPAEDMADIDTTTLEHLFGLNPSQLERWLEDHQIPVPGVSRNYPLLSFPLNR